MKTKATLRITTALALCLSLSIFLHSNAIILFAKTEPGLTKKETEELNVSASFTKKEWVTPTELIGLRLSRPLEAAEGTLAVFIDQTDVSSLFNSSDKRLKYSPQALQLPSGEHVLVVYLVSGGGEWKEIARFPLRVKAAGAPGQVEDSPTNTTNGLKKHFF
jgi:hypothetical protein